MTEDMYDYGLRRFILNSSWGGDAMMISIQNPRPPKGIVQCQFVHYESHVQKLWMMGWIYRIFGVLPPLHSINLCYHSYCPDLLSCYELVLRILFSSLTEFNLICIAKMFIYSARNWFHCNVFWSNIFLVTRLSPLCINFLYSHNLLIILILMLCLYFVFFSCAVSVIGYL